MAGSVSVLRPAPAAAEAFLNHRGKRERGRERAGRKRQEWKIGLGIGREWNEKFGRKEIVLEREKEREGKRGTRKRQERKIGFEIG